MKRTKFCARCDRLAIHRKTKSPYCESCENQIGIEESGKADEIKQKFLEEEVKRNQKIKFSKTPFISRFSLCLSIKVSQISS